MRDRHHLVRRSTLVLVALVIAIAGACGDDDDGSSSGSGDGTTVEALDNVFGEDPHVVRIDPGESVNWVNKGRNDHNIISVDGAPFGVGESEFQTGDEYSATFDEKGAFAYYCSLHGNTTSGMVGTVLVGDVATPKPPAQPPDLADIRASGNTIRVPDDHDTIQAAVDAADQGDLILIEAGTYKEAVEVPRGKDGITLRGLDRDEVILDGEFTRTNGVQVIEANGVAIENMTAQNYTKNGFYWTGVSGYRGSYLNALRNGDYGVYAFESRYGQFDNSYAAGSPDAGFYIGACYPCDALLVNIVAEWNGLGYSGTNSGGNLIIANSEWRNNRAGIVPNSGSYEPDYPQRENVIVGNLVHDNNNGKTSAIDIAVTAMGNGILVAGGVDNVIERNLVTNHDVSGIVVITYPESGEYIWDASGNIVRDNVVSESGLFDLGLWLDGEGKSVDKNCFEGNDFETSAPADIEEAAPCPGVVKGDLTNDPLPLAELFTNEGKPPAVSYEDVDLPQIPDGDHPQMSDPETAPARPAIDVPMSFDADSAEVPEGP